MSFLSPDRVNVDSLVRGAVVELRVFRDLVDFLEHLEVMDPRSVDDSDTDVVLRIKSLL